MIFRHPPGAGHLPPGKTCQSFPRDGWHAAGRTLSGRGEHLEDFYACLYYAAPRPLEALKLRESDLHLPKKGWGRIDLAASASRPGTAWTDHGTARQERGLKHRTAHETRTIPVPPELVQLLRAHIRRYGTTPDGRRRPPAGLRLQRGLDRGPRGPLTPAQYMSPLSRRPYGLRHAAVSLWLNSGVPATKVARRAGHGVAVLLKIYAHGTCRQADAANQRITDALGIQESQRDPGDEGGRQRAEVLKWQVRGEKRVGEVGVTAPTGPVRGLFRPRPWPARPPEPGAHGRIADGGSPESHLEAHMCWSVGVARAERPGCKTSAQSGWDRLSVRMFVLRKLTGAMASQHVAT